MQTITEWSEGAGYKEIESYSVMEQERPGGDTPEVPEVLEADQES